MINPVSLLVMISVMLGVGTFTWISWDQIAYSMKLPRPTWGAGVGVVFLAVLANFLWNNKITIGRTIAYSDNDPEPEAPKGGSSGGTEIRKNPPSDLAPLG